jgi:hypothetical protein
MNDIADHFEGLKKGDNAKLFRGKAKAARDCARTIHDVVLDNDHLSADIRLNKKGK